MSKRKVKCTKQEKWQEMSKKATRLPIHSPSVLGQELFARRLERIVRPEIVDRHRYPRDGVDPRLLHVFGNSDAVEAGP